MTFHVTVAGGVATEVYGGLPACDAYLLNKIGAGAKKYRSLTANGDDRKRLLIEATNFLERLSWPGAATTPAVGATVLAWPRTGVTVNGVAVDPNTVPAAIEKAAFELVAIFAIDNDAPAAADQGSNIKTLDADGTKIEFFRSTSARDGTAAVLPHVVQQLLGPYLDGGSTIVVLGSSSGTCAESQFDDCDTLSRSRPF